MCWINITQDGGSNTCSSLITLACAKSIKTFTEIEYPVSILDSTLVVECHQKLKFAFISSVQTWRNWCVCVCILHACTYTVLCKSLELHFQVFKHDMISNMTWKKSLLQLKTVRMSVKKAKTYTKDHFSDQKQKTEVQSWSVQNCDQLLYTRYWGKKKNTS